MLLDCLAIAEFGKKSEIEHNKIQKNNESEKIHLDLV